MKNLEKNTLLVYRKKLSKATVAGFDACLIGFKKGDNPYYRADFKRSWISGFELCERGEKFPEHLEK